MEGDRDGADATPAGDEPFAGVAALLDRVDAVVIGELATDELRSLRRACADAEEAVSYARRVLQGRLDILRAELVRREGNGHDGIDELIGALPSILASDHTPTQPAQVRSTRVRVPPAAQDYAARLDAIADESTLSGIDGATTDELAGLVARFAAEETRLSRLRQALFARVDGLRAELAERYKDGRADIGDLLGER